MNAVAQACGWLGAGLLLTAYWLVSKGRVEGGGAPFQLLNLAGGAGLTISSGVSRAWPSVALNLVWILIGVNALFKRRT